MQISVLSYICCVPGSRSVAIFFFVPAICGQKCGLCFLLALFFNAPTMFCDHAPHDEMKRQLPPCLAAPRHGRGAGARWGPRPWAGPLYIFEHPSTDLTPDQRHDVSLKQRFTKKTPRGIEPRMTPPIRSRPHGHNNSITTLQ